MAEHLAQLEKQLREVGTTRGIEWLCMVDLVLTSIHLILQAVDLGPVHINSHSGCDAWDEGGDALRFFEGALALQVRRWSR